MSAVVTEKVARTAEEKQAREARKAMKKAATAAQLATTPRIPAESVAGPSKANDPAVPAKQPKGVNAEDYEIDLAAPEPLSKAEIRLAKKRAKLGGRETGDVAVVDKAVLKKRKRVDPTYDPFEAENAATRDKEKSTTERSERHVAEGAAVPSREVKKQNSIWIGNLAFKTTPESLKAWLEKGVSDLGGTLGAVTRVNLPKKPGKGGYGESRGFAYVDFVSPEMQKLAVGLSEGMLEGRKLLIKLGNDHTASESARTPKPAKSLLTNPILRNQPNPESATLFMGNLPFDATEEAIRDLIEGNAEARKPRPERRQEEDKDANTGAEEGANADDRDAEGGVVDAEAAAAAKEEQAYRGGRKSGLRKVRLGAFEDTGRCKGFAFLDFIEPSNATAALANRRNHFFGNRKLTLQYASEEAVKRAGGKGSRARTDDSASAAKRPRPSSSDKRAPRAVRKEAHARTEGEDDTSAIETHTRTVSRDPAAIAREVLGVAVADGGGGGAGTAYEELSGQMQEARGKKDKGDVRGKKWQAAGRPRPGAALAMAKREKVGIVPGQGNKISFD